VVVTGVHEEHVEQLVVVVVVVVVVVDTELQVVQVGGGQDLQDVQVNP
jgi:hypothetical protein